MFLPALGRGQGGPSPPRHRASLTPARARHACWLLSNGNGAMTPRGRAAICCLRIKNTTAASAASIGCDRSKPAPSELSKACQRWQTCDQGIDRRKQKTSLPRKIKASRGAPTAGLARLIGAAAATWRWRSWFARLLADLYRDGTIELLHIGGAAKALKHALVTKLAGDDRKRNELLELGKGG